MDILSQKDMDAAFAGVDWHHAFVRELHLVSPSYYAKGKGSTVAPDFLPDVSVLISTGDSSCRHVEVVLREVEVLSIPCNVDIQPTGVVKGSQARIRFAQHSDNVTIAKSAALNMLGDEGGGYALRYGISSQFDETGIRKA